VSTALALRPYQEEAIAAVDAALEHGVRRPLIALPTGCHRANQPVLMYDGSTKVVEDVRVGDRVMGPDSRPRTVLRLERGVGPMMGIRPVKGEPWVVNDEHVLTLVETAAKASPRYPSQRGGTIRDVPLPEWQTWAAWRNHTHKLFRVGVDFPERADRPTIEPYLLGLLLGNGGLAHRSSVSITTTDPEVKATIHAAAQRYGLRVRRDGISFYLAGTRGAGGNPLNTELRKLGLRGVAGDERFVPDAYRLGSRRVRLDVLAGLLDSDGSKHGQGYDFCSKSAALADHVAFVARSLGLAAYVSAREVRSPWSGAVGTYFRVSIIGDASVIPCRVARKRVEPRRQKKDVLRTGFEVEPTGMVEPYYGFTLSGDGRYLLGDFTVTHNCGKTVIFAALIARRGGTALVVAHRDELLRQAADKLAVADPALGLSVGFVAAERDDVGAPVVVASVQTLARARRLARLPRRFDTVVIDEAHHASAASCRRVVEHVAPSPLILGVTATPQRSDRQQLGDVWQQVVYQRGSAELIRAGYLADVRGVRVGLQANLDDVVQSAGDFQADALGAALEDASAPRHVLAAYCEHAAGRKALVFVPTVALAHHMARMFQDAGIAAEALAGTTPAERRRAILDRLRAGDTRVCVNVAVLSEGFDEPSVDCVIVATPTRSQVKYIQCLDQDTEVLTRSGFRRAHEVAVGDEVAAVQPPHR
jgi:hypothetical protein